MSKTTLKSLEKMMVDMKADLEKGQRNVVKDMMVKIDSLTESVNFLNNQVQKVLNDNETMKKEMVKVKQSNDLLNKKLVEVEEKEKATSVKLNQIENWLRGNNIEIQGVPVVENEDISKVAMKVLKKLDPKIERNQMGVIRRMRTTNSERVNKNDANKKSNPILVMFKTREQKLNIMRERKNCII